RQRKDISLRELANRIGVREPAEQLNPVAEPQCGDFVLESLAKRTVADDPAFEGNAVALEARAAAHQDQMALLFDQLSNGNQSDLPLRSSEGAWSQGAAVDAEIDDFEPRAIDAVGPLDEFPIEVRDRAHE